MSTEESKFAVELAMFRKFVCASGLPVATGSERKGSALLREPDILCELSGESVGFELAEACAPEFAATAAASHHATDGVAAAWGDDASAATLRKKLAKRYVVTCPIHLLLYRNGFTALTDGIIVARLRPELAAGLGQFQTVWFHGDAAHRVAVA